MTDENIRKSFAQEIEDLLHSVLEMGAMTEDLIKGSVKALIEQDVALADKVIAADEEIDHKEIEIEEKCLRLLALQQPMASDLRTIESVLKIITDVERLADHTTKISKKAKILAALPQLKPYVDLPKMAERVTEMFHLSLEAFVKKDAELARKVIDMDDAVDEYNSRIFKELVDFMIKDNNCISFVSHLMVVVQSLERIADHVTNICERIIYFTTGKLSKLN
ncbi:MAG: phosphate signaling complex protein PhoU [bacterium]